LARPCHGAGTIWNSCFAEKILSFTPLWGFSVFLDLFQGFPPLATELSPLTGALKRKEERGEFAGHHTHILRYGLLPVATSVAFANSEEHGIAGLGRATTVLKLVLCKTLYIALSGLGIWWFLTQGCASLHPGL